MSIPIFQFIPPHPLLPASHKFIFILNERSQTEKVKYHMILLICGLLKKVKMNSEQNKK